MIAPAAGEQHPPEDHLCGAGRIGDLVRLVEQCRGGGQLALEAAQQRVVVERQRKHGERTGLASDLNVSDRECVPGVVVEQVRGDATSEPRPPHVSPGPTALVANGIQCPLESRRAGGVSVRETGGEAIEQQVDRIWGSR